MSPEGRLVVTLAAQSDRGSGGRKSSVRRGRVSDRCFEQTSQVDLVVISISDNTGFLILSVYQQRFAEFLAKQFRIWVMRMSGMPLLPELGVELTI